MSDYDNEEITKLAKIFADTGMNIEINLEEVMDEYEIEKPKSDEERSNLIKKIKAEIDRINNSILSTKNNPRSKLENKKNELKNKRQERRYERIKKTLDESIKSNIEEVKQKESLEESNKDNIEKDKQRGDILNEVKDITKKRSSEYKPIKGNKYKKMGLKTITDDELENNYIRIDDIQIQGDYTLLDNINNKSYAFNIAYVYKRKNTNKYFVITSIEIIETNEEINVIVGKIETVIRNNSKINSFNVDTKHVGGKNSIVIIDDKEYTYKDFRKLNLKYGESKIEINDDIVNQNSFSDNNSIEEISNKNKLDNNNSLNVNTPNNNTDIINKETIQNNQTNDVSDESIQNSQIDDINNYLQQVDKEKEIQQGDGINLIQLEKQPIYVDDTPIFTLNSNGRTKIPKNSIPPVIQNDNDGNKSVRPNFNCIQKSSEKKKPNNDIKKRNSKNKKSLNDKEINMDKNFGDSTIDEILSQSNINISSDDLTNEDISTQSINNNSNLKRRKSLVEQNESESESQIIDHYKYQLVDKKYHKRNYEISDNIVFYDDFGSEIVDEQDDPNKMEEENKKTNKYLTKTKKRFKYLRLKQVNSRMISPRPYECEDDPRIIKSYLDIQRYPFSGNINDKFKDYIYLEKNSPITVKIYRENKGYIISDLKTFNIGLKDKKNIKQITFDYFMSLDELFEIFGEFGAFIMFILQNTHLIFTKDDVIRVIDDEIYINYDKLISGFTVEDLSAEYKATTRKKPISCNIVAKLNNEYYDDKYLVLYYYYIYVLKLSNNYKYKNLNKYSDVQFYKPRIRLDLQMSLDLKYNLNTKINLNNDNRIDDEIFILNSAIHLIKYYRIGLENITNYYTNFYFDHRRELQEEFDGENYIHIIDPIIVFNYLIEYSEDYYYNIPIHAKSGLLLEIVKDANIDIINLDTQENINSQNDIQNNDKQEVTNLQNDIQNNDNQQNMEEDNSININEYYELKEKIYRRQSLTELIQNSFNIIEQRGEILDNIFSSIGNDIIQFIMSRAQNLTQNDSNLVIQLLNLLFSGNNNNTYNEQRVLILLELLIRELKKDLEKK